MVIVFGVRHRTVLLVIACVDCLDHVPAGVLVGITWIVDVLDSRPPKPNKSRAKSPPVVRGQHITACPDIFGADTVYHATTFATLHPRESNAEYESCKNKRDGRDNPCFAREIV